MTSTSSNTVSDQLAHNLCQVRQRISVACDRVGRSLEDVTLIAVTKYAPLNWVRELIALGVTDLGESRPQQLIARAKELSPSVRWHQIGHLQRNKADSLLSVVERIHSVDSIRLIEQLAKSAVQQNCRARILLEVNVTGEPTKDGFVANELIAAWPALLEQPALGIDGLMTMAPLNESPEVARAAFRGLRELRDRLVEISRGASTLPQLSMGMSGDFEVGIEEGATFVRIGSSLFEGLPIA